MEEKDYRKKQVPLRLSPKLYADIAQWAEVISAPLTVRLNICYRNVSADANKKENITFKKTMIPTNQKIHNILPKELRSNRSSFGLL
jgi:hypothetical protein